MSDYKVNFRDMKSRVGIDDIAYALGYRLDRKAGVGRTGRSETECHNANGLPIPGYFYSWSGMSASCRSTFWDKEPIHFCFGFRNT